MSEKAHIILRLFLPTRGDEEIAKIYSMALSPVAIEKRLKFSRVGKDDQYSFDQLRDVLSEITIKKGDVLPLSVINPETGEKQDFRLNISKDWPDGLVGEREVSYEITSALKKIGIL